MRLLRTEKSFAAAVDDYTRFLREHGIDGTPQWIFCEDVLLYRKRYHVRWPLPRDNPALAQDHYEAGRDRGLGLELAMFCLVGETPCCYVFSPRDEEEAGRIFVADLKLSVRCRRDQAVPVKSAWKWAMLRRLATRDMHWIEDELPRKSGR